MARDNTLDDDDFRRNNRLRQAYIRRGALHQDVQGHIQLGRGVDRLSEEDIAEPNTEDPRLEPHREATEADLPSQSIFAEEKELNEVAHLADPQDVDKITPAPKRDPSAQEPGVGLSVPPPQKEQPGEETTITDELVSSLDNGESPVPSVDAGVSLSDSAAPLLDKSLNADAVPVQRKDTEKGSLLDRLKEKGRR